TGTSGNVTVNAGAANRLVITGTGTQTAGATQSLTITAKDAGGSTVTSYTGDKALTFSGAASSTNPVTAPTVSDKTGVAVAFGTARSEERRVGRACGCRATPDALKIYKAE